MVAVPRLLAGLLDGETPPLGSGIWQGTAVPAAGRWRDVVAGTEIAGGDKGISAGELFAILPIAVLRAIP